MKEPASVPEARTRAELSAQDRLTLIQTLNALPRPQFNELVFALKPPNANVPSNPASQGDRSKALLDWAESPIGPGLPELEIILESIITTHSNKAQQFTAIVIKGEIDPSTMAQIQDVFQRLRKKHQCNSIEVEVIVEGSIKIIVSGSPEELAQLQEMIGTDELEYFSTQSVEEVYQIDNDTPEARKARLIQALRLRQPSIITITNYADGDRSSAIGSAIASAIASVIAIGLDLGIGPAISLAISLIIVNDLISNLISNLKRDRDDLFDGESLREIAFKEAVEVDLRNADLKDANLRGIDLRNADLKDANLRGIDLRNADLTGADLTNADVTGTLFGNNQGLTDADKRDLQRRGAIFEEPPSSDVPDLVPR